MESDIAKKIIKIVLKILYQILIIFCILLIGVVVLQRVSNSNRTVLGYRIFRVITGSMEPEYDIGTVVICKETGVNDNFYHSPVPFLYIAILYSTFLRASSIGIFLIFTNCKTATTR